MSNGNEFKNEDDDSPSGSDDSDKIRRGFETIRKETQKDDTNSEEVSTDMHPSSLPSWLPSASSSSSLPSLLLAASVLASPLTAGGTAVEQLPPSVLLAAFAATEGFKHLTTGYLQQQQLDQNFALHKKEYSQANRHHIRELEKSIEIHEKEYKQSLDMHKLDWQKSLLLHDDDLEREAEQHLQDLTNQLRESQKEADRDLWEQQNTEKQNTMTVTALLLTGAFALTVEGQLPTQTYGLWIYPKVPLVDIYYGCLSLALSLLFVSILAGMAAVRRMSEFMLSRTSKQQETLRELRQIAFEQLEHLHRAEDIDKETKRQALRHHKTSSSHSSSSSTSTGAATLPSQNKSNRPAPLRTIFSNNDDNDANIDHRTEAIRNNLNHELDNRRSTQEVLRKARRDFSKRLWEQPVLVSNWRSLGHGLHVVNFDEWYHFDIVSLLSNMNVFFFKVGAVFLLLSMGLYTEAHQRWDDNTFDDNAGFDDDDDDDDDSLDGNRSAVIFWVIIVLIAIGFLLFFEVFEYVYKLPSWRSVDDESSPSEKAQSNSLGSSSSSSFSLSMPSTNKFKRSASSSSSSSSSSSFMTASSSSATSYAGSGGSGDPYAFVDYGTQVEVVGFMDPNTLEPSVHNHRLGYCLEPLIIDQTEEEERHFNRYNNGGGGNKGGRSRGGFPESLRGHVTFESENKEESDSDTDDSDLGIGIKRRTEKMLYSQTKANGEQVVGETTGKQTQLLWRVCLLKSYESPHYLEEDEIDIPIENLRIPTVTTTKSYLQHQQEYHQKFREREGNFFVRLIFIFKRYFCKVFSGSIFFNSSFGSYFIFLQRRQKQQNSLRKASNERSYLMTVNVTDMQSKKTELFKLIDVDGNGEICMSELCTMLLRFQPPAIPTTTSSKLTKSKKQSTRYENKTTNKSTTTEFQNLILAKKSTENANIAHEMLRQYPMLQEAILELVEKLLHHEPSFIKLKFNDESLAFAYLSFLMKLVETSLHQIRNGVIISEMNVNISFWDKFMNYRMYRRIFKEGSLDTSDLEQLSYERNAAIPKKEWDRIMNRIFLEKFF